MKEVTLTKDEARAQRLLVCLLEYKDKHGLEGLAANWIIRGCGLLKASKSLLKKLDL